MSYFSYRYLTSRNDTKPQKTKMSNIFWKILNNLPKQGLTMYWFLKSRQFCNSVSFVASIISALQEQSFGTHLRSINSRRPFSHFARSDTLLAGAQSLTLSIAQRSTSKFRFKKVVSFNIFEYYNLYSLYNIGYISWVSFIVECLLSLAWIPSLLNLEPINI